MPPRTNRGGLWVRIHRAGGDCVLQVEAHGYSMERLRQIVTSELALVVAVYDGTSGDRFLIVEARRNEPGANEPGRLTAQ
jgi:hypothetical protein